ncbi:MAG: RNA-binding domain-containing protein [Candidatus Thermoplasmatota archaeon]
MAALRYHWIRLRATCHPTEELAKVETAMRHAAGVPDLAINAEAMETHHGGTIHILEAALDKSRAVRDALGRLLVLPGARDDLTATVEARTDDDGVFYVRLDKQEAFAGRLVLTRGEDAIQMRLKMEHYPATREAALASLEILLATERP